MLKIVPKQTTVHLTQEIDLLCQHCRSNISSVIIQNSNASHKLGGIIITGAEEGSQTLTPVQAADFECAASASSAMR